MGKAVKIIDIDESGEHFELKEDVLHAILSKVPDDLPVTVVGVVGAFRTGKSFLLDFFLRYLKNTDPGRLDADFDREDTRLKWMTQGGKLEGSEHSEEEGFKWKAGNDRCTTGIWLWSDYFLRVDPDTQKQTAVFLMDTQGMYDGETGQHLTASIFGLSTLISSYTVFNIMFQIQEDHLQHLALFSEYGRVALTEANLIGGKASTDFHPFQKLEFLVRDFTHFKKNSKKNSGENELEEMQQEMATYLEKMMSRGLAKEQKDLKEVREQVELCYEEISCYCLPHPGHIVAEEDEDFDGDLSELRPKFKRLLGDYIRRVFNDRISIKKIQNQETSSLKLFEFIKVYCKLFQESEIFPEAMTLFRATQEANLQYALTKSLQVYKHSMDQVCGIGSQHLKDEELSKHHKRSIKLSIKEFSVNTKLGTEKFNSEGLKVLKKNILERYKEYQESNRLRDPMAFVAPYVIPILIGVAAYVVRYVLETVCPRRSFTCLDFADFFGSLYTVIFSFLIFHALSTMYGVSNHLGGMFKMAAKIKTE